MEKCPRCGAAAILAEEAHCDCPGCGFYWNPHLFDPWVKKQPAVGWEKEPKDEHEDAALPPAED